MGQTEAAVALDGMGNIYGTTNGFTTYGPGAVFKLTSGQTREEMARIAQELRGRAGAELVVANDQTMLTPERHPTCRRTLVHLRMGSLTGRPCGRKSCAISGA